VPVKESQSKRISRGLAVARDRLHDYKRNGATTLFAALNMLDGTVIGECMPRHRHREFLRFLNTIDERTPPNLDLHLIVDNYAIHKTPAVKRWLKRHSRFHLHFTPTSASWLNMVERFFGDHARPRARRLRCPCGRAAVVAETTGMPSLAAVVKRIAPAARSK
jgi:transposase